MGAQARQPAAVSRGAAVLIKKPRQAMMVCRGSLLCLFLRIAGIKESSSLLLESEREPANSRNFKIIYNKN